LSNRYKTIDGERIRNEITLFIRGRYMCGNEAVWRILNYQTYPSPSPSVITVKVTMEEELKDNVSLDNTSHMEVYLRRPNQYENDTFSAFWAKYLYGRKLSKTAKNNNKYSTIILPNRSCKYFIYERADTDDRVLVRIGTVHYSSGEKFYLRLLMLNKVIPTLGIYSTSCDIGDLYKHIRTHESKVYDTFQEAAVASGIVGDEEVMLEIFTDFETTSACSLRSLFVNLTVIGYPTKTIIDMDYWIDMMTADLRNQKNYSDKIEIKKELLLNKLQRLLQSDFNRNLCEFGLPMPQNIETELNIMRIEYPSATQTTLLQELHNRYPCNDEQRHIYNEIIKAIRDVKDARYNNRKEECRMFHLNGLAGCGKTALAKKLIAYTRSINGIAIGCAATALAASLYNDNFMTAHSLFAYPVSTDSNDAEDNNPEISNDNLRCMLYEKKYAYRKELVEAANLIVWDEFTCNHRELVESVFEVMHGLRNTVVVFIGGYEQILPIIEYQAPKWRILEACLCQSALWNRVDVRTLRRNMRLTRMENKNEQYRQNQYEQFLNALSSGDKLTYNNNHFARSVELTETELESIFTHPMPNDILHDVICYELKHLNIVIEEKPIEEQIAHMKSYENRFTNELIPFCSSTISVLQFLYGRNYEQFTQTENMNRFICAATNIRVKFWNDVVQHLNMNTTYTFKSSNELTNVDDEYNYIKQMFSIDCINDALDDSDVPNHTLNLKLNDICLLTCNYSKSKGLTKNAKVRICSVSTNCKKIGLKFVHDPQGETMFIPRLKSTFTYRHGASYKVNRTQFPLRLAYCLTYNRSQGQTADRIVLDVVHPPFSHGQFYVAATRTRAYNQTMIYGHESQCVVDPDTVQTTIRIPSITHKELLK